jgi:chemotaxis protein methyltransferase CheR
MEKKLSTTFLSNAEFEKLSRFIYAQCGIKLTTAKKNMVEARLRKRLKDLEMNSYSEYCDYIFSRDVDDSEITQMVDVITTNKTDFFREPKQFEFLNDTALPELINLDKTGINRPLRVWSAGCSSGEEPYTLSIVLNEFANKINNYSFGILATDISTRVLEKAKLAIYDEDRVEPVSEELLKKYFLRSKDKQKKLVRLVPEIRNSINFQWLNLMESDFGFRERFDIIFCRNVIIYFDKPTQDKLIAKLISYIRPGGYLFLGHSESIFNNNLPIAQMMASTYRVIR